MKVESLRNLNCPVVINLHVSSVTSEIFSIKIDTVFTHLSVLHLAVSTSEVRIPDRTDSNFISYFYSSYSLSDHGDLSDYLMAWTRRVWNITYINVKLPQCPLMCMMSE
jgi:hypothetical protein